MTMTQSFTVTRDAYDERADFKRRTVHMSMTQVSIERVMRGIKMSIAVPVATYASVIIRVQAPNGSATARLAHRDGDFDVVLASGEARDVTIAAKAWAAVLEKAIVVEAGVVMMAPTPRGAKRPVVSTRSRFARNRKLGDRRLLKSSFAGEHEIIARD